MILVNGCSHTHGTAHANDYNYKDKLWPNIAGEIIGDTDVINLAKGGDSNMCIADSTIHWLETNIIKPEMVIIQWTYQQRFELPYHRKYADDPFRDWGTAEPLVNGEQPPNSDSWVFLAQYPREGINWLTSTGIFLTNDENDTLQKNDTQINHLGLSFPEVLFNAGFKQDIHPYFLGKDDDPRIQNIIDYYKRYVDYREAVCNLPTHREYTIHKWATAQNWLASYLEANDIPYYWWGVDSWHQSEMADVLYLKPKYGNEMFGNINRIDHWLERQGIIANGDIIEYAARKFVDDHRGEDGHKYIGEMVGNFIKHGIEPDPNAEDRELLKKNLEARPNLNANNFITNEDSFNDGDEIESFQYTELWKFATGEIDEMRHYKPNPPNFYYD